ncbi:MAG: TIGR00730 family Rossman fold protein [Deltaproteobacteria bacterium]|nr:TIGR00730 family Rossman fold protein [Nannocystaceae bacterium]
MATITVFCGSNSGVRPDYVAAAVTLGRLLAERGDTLVYGGSSVGLMGALADAALAAGGKVVGIIPEALKAREVDHRGLTELHVVDSMHTRKRMMADRADAFVALPGGAGTLEELFEVWTWAQLGDHRKPCALLDVAGYYAALAGFLDHMVAEGFIRSEHRRMLMVDTDPRALLDRFAGYEPPQVTKWIANDET